MRIKLPEWPIVLFYWLTALVLFVLPIGLVFIVDAGKASTQKAFLFIAMMWVHAIINTFVGIGLMKGKKLGFLGAYLTTAFWGVYSLYRILWIDGERVDGAAILTLSLLVFVYLVFLKKNLPKA